MLYTVKEDLELCEQFKLSPMQLFFLKLYIQDPNKTEGDQIMESKKLRLKFQSVFSKRLITPNELADLISRDIIEDYNEAGDHKLFDLFELSGKWRNKLRLAVYPMPAELCDAYPIKGEINGKHYNPRNASENEIAQGYLRAINKDTEEHARVLDDLKWAIDNNQINIGLKNFVNSKYWLYIRAVRETKVDKGIFNNLNIL